MKYIIIIVLCALSLVSTGQVKSGEIIYSVHEYDFSEKGAGSKDIGYKEFKNDLYDIALNLKFRLSFNQTQSSFAIVKELPVDFEDFKTRMAVLLLRGKSIFFTDIDKKYLLEQKEIMNEPFIIKANFDELDWELTKESKKISDFSCYKAVGRRAFRDKNGNTKEAKLIAWYCPEIPYGFGPFEAVSLPGMVLEFKSGQFVFTASKIDFNKSETEIVKPSKGKLLSQKELDKIINDKVSKEIRKG
ncbi:MAG: GLPGLI family protein [Bacteroidota bacterium]